MSGDTTDFIHPRPLRQIRDMKGHSALREHELGDGVPGPGTRQGNDERALTCGDMRV
jgi:hypothetical protein